MIRGEKVPEGTYHLVVAIWTVNSNGQLLLTLRSPEKALFPNEWENTAGSVLAGESSLTGACRELMEETGITVCKDELFLISTLREESAFIDTYLIKKDVPIESLTMQAGETTAARWVTLDELEDMITAGLMAAPVARRFARLRRSIEAYL